MSAVRDRYLSNMLRCARRARSPMAGKVGDGWRVLVPLAQASGLFSPAVSHCESELDLQAR